MVGTLTIHLHLPACGSLKEKRGRLKPLIARLQREFNVSAAEMDLHDRWQETVIACALVSTDEAHIQRSLQNVGKWVQANWPDGDVIEQKIELIS